MVRIPSMPRDKGAKACIYWLCAVFAYISEGIEKPFQRFRVPRLKIKIQILHFRAKDWHSNGVNHRSPVRIRTLTSCFSSTDDYRDFIRLQRYYCIPLPWGERIEVRGSFSLIHPNSVSPSLTIGWRIENYVLMSSRRYRIRQVSWRIEMSAFVVKRRPDPISHK